jgi:hypothetical protein
MLIKDSIKIIYRQINKILEKFGFLLIRHIHYKYLFDCNFLPYEVEYKSSPVNMQKLLAHIDNTWNNYGKNNTYWSVLTKINI